MKKTMLKILLALVVIASLALTFGYVKIQDYLNEPGPAAQETTVIIEPGSSSQKIAQLLAEAGVIEHPDLFRILAVLNKQHQRFQAGEYLFKAGISPNEVAQKLISGDIVIRQVTIPEGFTSAQVIALLNQQDDLAGPQLTETPKEGSLLPETYRYKRGDTRADVIKQMQDAMREVLKTIAVIPPNRDLLPDENALLTLASIVEKETAIDSERTQVAGVYVNRLRKGMLLQADPTVAYGRYGGQYADKPLRVSDLKADTPYNTYLHTGLPPGPICNPGRASLEAAANPMQTDAIFFVADGKGGHIFARTLEEHNRNVAAYRKWYRENNP